MGDGMGRLVGDGMGSFVGDGMGTDVGVGIGGCVGAGTGKLVGLGAGTGVGTGEGSPGASLTQTWCVVVLSSYSAKSSQEKELTPFHGARMPHQLPPHAPGIGEGGVK